MGTSLSTCSRKERRTISNDSCPVSWRWNGPPGDHSPYPTEKFAKRICEVSYCFVDILVSFKIMKTLEECLLPTENEINFGPPAVTTDVEKYMHLLMDCYNDGFSLVKFVRVPVIHMSTDVTNWIADRPYQAIFTKDNVIGQEFRLYDFNFTIPRGMFPYSPVNQISINVFDCMLNASCDCWSDPDPAMAVYIAPQSHNWI